MVLRWEKKYIGNNETSYCWQFWIDQNSIKKDELLPPIIAVEVAIVDRKYTFKLNEVYFFDSFLCKIL